MTEPLPFGPGATLLPAMLSPCVGGMVRTWTSEGTTLWAVDGNRLAWAMGQGWIARTLRERDRYREVGLLHQESGTLLLQPRFPDRVSESGWAFEDPLIRLMPAGEPTPTVAQGFRDLLGRAVDFTVASEGFLVLERGGWDAPIEPYCLFMVFEAPGGEVSLIETAPPPLGARHWARHIVPDASGATVRAHATPESIAVAPLLILEACSTWGLSPWDLALTYGNNPALAASMSQHQHDRPTHLTVEEAERMGLPTKSSVRLSPEARAEEELVNKLADLEFVERERARLEEEIDELMRRYKRPSEG